MLIKQLKPKTVFKFNGIPLVVRRNERLGDGRCRLHVRLDGYDGRVHLPAEARALDYADPVKFSRRRRQAGQLQRTDQSAACPSGQARRRQ